MKLYPFQLYEKHKNSQFHSHPSYWGGGKDMGKNGKIQPKLSAWLNPSRGKGGNMVYCDLGELTLMEQNLLFWHSKQAENKEMINAI